MSIAVSVLLPVFNAAPYLPGALASLEPDLDTDVEVICVNDGSTDGSGDILDRWEQPRLRVLHQANQGLVASLNAAAEQARGSLLARMDADDLNRPGRIPACRELLTTRPDVSLVSPWAQQIDAEGQAGVLWQPPWRPADVNRALYVDNPIIHGAAMFRRDTFEAAGGYQPAVAEDLDLWARIADRSGVALIPQALYDYRVHAASVSGEKAQAFQDERRRIGLARWAHRPAPIPPPWTTTRYRRTPTRPVVRENLRNLARLAKQHGDLPRLAGFAAAHYAA